jgi:hypothetical protein
MGQACRLYGKIKIYAEFLCKNFLENGILKNLEEYGRMI